MFDISFYPEIKASLSIVDHPDLIHAINAVRNRKLVIGMKIIHPVLYVLLIANLKEKGMNGVTKVRLKCESFEISNPVYRETSRLLSCIWCKVCNQSYFRLCSQL